MNSDTGEIKEFQKDEVIPPNWVPIERKDMTEKQEKNKAVSLLDHASKLGIILTGTHRHRREEARRLIKEARRNKSQI